MANDDIIQVISDAREDAVSLSQFMYYPATVTVNRRLAPPIHTLEYYLQYLEGLEKVYSQPTGTVEVNGEVVKTVRQSINDAIDSAILGDYQTTLEAELVQEVIRATNRENDIEDALDAEVIRATDAEGVISQDLSELSLEVDSQKLDTGITATAKFGGVVRILSDKLTDYNTPKDFGAESNSELDLLGLTLPTLDVGTVLHTDNRSFTVATTGATDYDVITTGGTKLYINKEKTSFATRAEFVSAVEGGLKIKKDTVVQAGNVSYIYDKTSTDILDLPNFRPFGDVEFEHYGGKPKRTIATKAYISHYRESADRIFDVTRIVNPTVGLFTAIEHPDMDRDTGISPRMSLREMSKHYDISNLVNSTGFINADNSSGAGAATIKPYGLYISNGEAISDWNTYGNTTRDQALLCLKNGDLVPRYKSDGGTAQDYVDEGAVWGFGWGVWCLLGGVVQDVGANFAGTSKSARTIIGQAENGDYIVIVSEGVSDSYGIAASECGAVALQYGCVKAFICDGGGSSQLWLDDFYALPSSDNGFTSERTLCTAIAINCTMSTYDTGWVDQPLQAGFIKNSDVGVRYRQVDNRVSLEFSVGGSFTTSAQEVCANSKPLRYMPTNGLVVARGAAGGNGGVPAYWVMANNVALATVAGSPSYIAGHTSWSTKHPPTNTSL